MKLKKFDFLTFFPSKNSKFHNIDKYPRLKLINSVNTRMFSNDIINVKNICNSDSRKEIINDNFNYKTKLSSSLNNELLDNFGRFHNYLRISITERCNLRCTYCMPEKGIDLTPKNNLMNLSELSKLISIFVGLGVDKIRLTGGEPTVNPNCEDIIKEIRKYESVKSICMTTNAYTIKNKLKKFKEAGLTHLNISLDTLVESKFNFISRREGLKYILENINLALDLNFEKIKINCVIMKGVNEDEILDFVNLTKDKKLDVRFIEFMPFNDNSK